MHVAKSHDAHLVHFNIDKKFIPQIKQELHWAGVSESTVYPDLDGFGRELTYWFVDKLQKQL